MSDDTAPPQDLTAEASVLGAAMLTPAAMDEAAATLTPADFYRPAHQSIFAACLDLHTHGKPVDPVTVAAALGAELARVGGGAYLHTLVSGTPSARAAGSYARIVAGVASRRRILAAGERITQLARAGTEDLLSAADETLRAASGGVRTDRAQRIGDLLDPLLDRLEEPVTPGIRTGWDTLDEIMLPLTPGRLVVAGGRPGSGKSTWCLDLARHASAAGERVAFCTLEMGADETTQRLLAAEARVPLDAIQRHNLRDDDWHRVAGVRDRMLDSTLLIDDTAGHTLATLNATVRRHRPTLLVVDYLQLLTPADHKVPREQQVAAMSRGLKLMAKTHGIPVVVACQLNRASEARADKKPGLSDLRESGAIEQDADVVCLLHRPDYYESQDRPGEVDVIVAKQRNGPTGTRTLAAQLHYSRMVDLHKWAS